MSAVEPTTLNQIIRTGWKQLANCDQSDADEVSKILRETLEALETIETAEK